MIVSCAYTCLLRITCHITFIYLYHFIYVYCILHFIYFACHIRVLISFHMHITFHILCMSYSCTYITFISHTSFDLFYIFHVRFSCTVFMNCFHVLFSCTASMYCFHVLLIPLKRILELYVPEGIDPKVLSLYMTMIYIYMYPKVLSLYQTMISICIYPNVLSLYERMIYIYVTQTGSSYIMTKQANSLYMLQHLYPYRHAYLFLYLVISKQSILLLLCTYLIYMDNYCYHVCL